MKDLCEQTLAELRKTRDAASCEIEERRAGMITKVAEYRQKHPACSFQQATQEIEKELDRMWVQSEKEEEEAILMEEKVKLLSKGIPT